MWNLSCLLHEAAVTGGWHGHVSWPIRNRLENNGYDGWGFSANLEPEGFTLLTKGFTVIGLTDQLELPQPGQCGRVASLFRKLSDADGLRVLLFVTGRQKGRDETICLSLEELAEGAGLSPDDCRTTVGKLLDYGWLEEQNNDKQGYGLVNRLEAILMPLLASAGVFTKVR